MSNVIQLVKRLEERPEPAAPSGIVLRNFRTPSDVGPWLELRNRAFARSPVGIRSWTAEDFNEEFLEKSWWQEDRMWLAEVQGLDSRQLVGSVTLALRGEGEGAKPVVHWLVVAPNWRRRGIGQLLMGTLEQAAWDAGYRSVWLETHAAWTAAAALYEKLGYRTAPAGGVSTGS